MPLQTQHLEQERQAKLAPPLTPTFIESKKRRDTRITLDMITTTRKDLTPEVDPDQEVNPEHTLVEGVVEATAGVQVDEDVHRLTRNTKKKERETKTITATVAVTQNQSITPLVARGTEVPLLFALDQGL